MDFYRRLTELGFLSYEDYLASDRWHEVKTRPLVPGSPLHGTSGIGSR